MLNFYKRCYTQHSCCHLLPKYLPLDQCEFLKISIKNNILINLFCCGGSQLLHVSSQVWHEGFRLIRGGSGPPALGTWNLTHWTTRKVPSVKFCRKVRSLRFGIWLWSLLCVFTQITAFLGSNFLIFKWKQSGY